MHGKSNSKLIRFGVPTDAAITSTSRIISSMRSSSINSSIWSSFNSENPTLSPDIQTRGNVANSVYGHIHSYVQN